jgi:hypothetical protein
MHDETLKSLSKKLQKLVTVQLHEGERVLWADNPKPFSVEFSSRRDSFAFFLKILPLLFFGSFSFLFLLAAAIQFRLDILIIGLILLGLALPFLGLALRQACKIGYVITNYRAMIVSTSWSKRTLSYDRINPLSLTVVERRDGSGDLLFIPAELLKKGFKGVRNVRQVETLIRETFTRNWREGLPDLTVTPANASIYQLYNSAQGRSESDRW